MIEKHFVEAGPMRAWAVARRVALVFLCAALPALSAISADFGAADRERANAMLRGVQRVIEEKYYDPAHKGIDLDAAAAAARERIAKAGAIGETLAAIAQFALDLDDSHTFFIPPAQTANVDYGWEMGMVGEVCHVLRVKPDSDAARQGVARGDVVKTVNGLAPTRDSLWRIEYLFRVLRPQPGLHVQLLTSKGAARELDLAANVKQRKKVLDLAGFDRDWNIARLVDDAEKSERDSRPLMVESGKGVLIARVPTFTLDDDAINQVWQRARRYEALILDLRGNGGGALSALTALLGGLSATDVTIGMQKERDRSTPLVAKSAGKDAFGGRLFVLVDAESASASELIARAVQLGERGSVIGDRTAGAVMAARFQPLRISHGENTIVYGVNATVADVVMSDGGRLEKNGVKPDFVVLPSAQDMAAGRDPALAQALKFAGQNVDPAAAGTLLHR